MTDTLLRRAHFSPGLVTLASDISPDGTVTVEIFEVFYDFIDDQQGTFDSVELRISAVIQPNVEMFQAALDQITNRPLTWNQVRWLTPLPEVVAAEAAAAPECGTAGCLAGTVGLMAGFRPGTVGIREQFETSDGETRDPSRVSDDVLGLASLRSAHDLYFAGNTLHDLWAKAQVLCGGALTVPDAETIEAAQELSWGLYGKYLGW